MKLYKQLHRERALARFSIQTEQQWNNGRKGDEQIAGSYADYVERKNLELRSLKG